jgi:hypothetical protein
VAKKQVSIDLDQEQLDMLEKAKQLGYKKAFIMKLGLRKAFIHLFYSDKAWPISKMAVEDYEYLKAYRDRMENDGATPEELAKMDVGIQGCRDFLKRIAGEEPKTKGE